MNQTPNPDAYAAWNSRPEFMLNVHYTSNQWHEIHDWLANAFTAARADEREKNPSIIVDVKGHLTRETVEQLKQTIMAARDGDSGYTPAAIVGNSANGVNGTIRDGEQA